MRRRAVELATRTEEAVTRAVEVLVDEGIDSKTLRAVADHILDRSRRFLEVISPRAKTRPRTKPSPVRWIGGR